MLHQLLIRFGKSEKKNYIFICIILIELQEEGKRVRDYMAQGAKCLAEALKSWTHKKDVSLYNLLSLD